MAWMRVLSPSTQIPRRLHDRRVGLNRQTMRVFVERLSREGRETKMRNRPLKRQINPDQVHAGADAASQSEHDRLADLRIGESGMCMRAGLSFVRDSMVGRERFSHLLPVGALSVATFNATSLHLSDLSDRLKRGMRRATIAAIMELTLIIAIQETRASTEEAALFAESFHSWDMISSQEGQGTALLWNRNLQSIFDIVPRAAQEGDMLYLNMTHRKYNYTVKVVAAYWTTGDPRARQQQLGRLECELKRGPKADYIYLMGDFNFDLSAATREASSFLDTLGALYSIILMDQQASTYNQGSASTKLDHIVIGSRDDNGLASLMNAARFEVKLGDLGDTGAHTPVLLTARDVIDGTSIPEVRSPAIIPEWISKSEVFRDKITLQWLHESPKLYKRGIDAMGMLGIFIKRLHAAGMRWVRETNAISTQLNTAQSSAVRLLTEIRRRMVNQSGTSANPPNARGVSPNRSDANPGFSRIYIAECTKIERQVANAEISLGEAYRSTEEVIWRITAQRRLDKVKTAEAVIDGANNDNSQLPAPAPRKGMMTGGPAHANLRHIAKRIARVYGYQPPLLDEGIEHRGSAKASVLERHYTNLLGSEATTAELRGKFLDMVRAPGSARRFFDANMILEVTVEIVLFVLQNRMSNSAPGISGIRLSLLQLVHHVYVPLIKNVIDQLAQSEGTLPASGRSFFNVALMITLIKKVEKPMSVANSRGISINCFTNRHISAVLVHCLTGAFSKMIANDQFAFIPARMPTQSLATFLDSFYTNVRLRTPVFVLMTDFSKAYDSVDHALLFQLLDLYGLPATWINILRCLHEWSYGCVSADVSRRVLIRRGVKQGCPVSCLIFLVYMQAISDIIRGHTIRQHLFVDDLNCFLKDIRSTARVVIDLIRIGEMINFRLSIPKTMVVPTTPVSAEDRLVFDSMLVEANLPECRSLRFVDKAAMLGIPFGRVIAMSDIFEPFIQKFEQRARRFRNQSMAGLPVRVTYANSFITPILDYPSQMYIIPPVIASRYLDAMRYLLLPRFRAIPITVAIAAPEVGGFMPRVRNAQITGMASIVRCLTPAFVNAGYIGHPREFEWHQLSPFWSLKTAYEYLERWEVIKGIPPIPVVQSELYGKIIVSRGLKADEEAVKATVVKRVRKLLGEDISLDYFFWSLAEIARYPRLAHPAMVHRFALFNALPLHDRLKYVDRDAPTKPCPVCGGGPENVPHMLILCPPSRIFWREWQGEVAHPSLAQVLCGEPLPGTHPLILVVYTAVVYRARNAMLHQVTPVQHKEYAMAATREYRIPESVRMWDDGG